MRERRKSGSRGRTESPALTPVRDAVVLVARTALPASFYLSPSGEVPAQTEWSEARDRTQLHDLMSKSAKDHSMKMTLDEQQY